VVKASLSKKKNGEKFRQEEEYSKLFSNEVGFNRKNMNDKAKRRK